MGTLGAVRFLCFAHVTAFTHIFLHMGWIFRGILLFFFLHPPPQINLPLCVRPCVCVSGVCVCGLNYSRITMTRLILHYLGCRAKKYAVTTEWRGSGMAVAKSRPHVCPRLRLGVHCAANRCPSGTPSECLFFFGIYSFTSVNRKTRSSNFWRRQRHPLHIPQNWVLPQNHTVGSQIIHPNTVPYHTVPFTMPLWIRHFVNVPCGLK